MLGITAGETAYFFTYLKNTVIMWLCGFIPQILLSLLLAAWLTNNRVKLRGQGAIKVMTYMPNIIAASSISVLFGALFSQYGPITMTLKNLGILDANFDFMQSVVGARGLISFILFWMWYGNTTLLLLCECVWLFPLQARFQNTDIGHLKNAMALFRLYIPHSLLVLLIWALPLALSIAATEIQYIAFWLWLTCGFASLFYLCAYFFRNDFDKLQV
ncbi:MAG: hypothetical protein LUG55_06925 [Clostridiales bacterium]|nr:hypothetical protein [Clostridiales bacterium]